jgi:transposase-like protein
VCSRAQSSRTLLSLLLPGFVTIGSMPEVSDGATKRIELDRPELVTESRPTSIACPLCRSDDVRAASNNPAIMLYSCRQCSLTFLIALSAPRGAC